MIWGFDRITKSVSPRATGAVTVAARTATPEAAAIFGKSLLFIVPPVPCP